MTRLKGDIATAGDEPDVVSRPQQPRKRVIRIDPFVNFVVSIYCYSVLLFEVGNFACSAIAIYFRGLFRLIVPKPKFSLVGEFVLVTGAGAGIGRELCLQLARMKAVVVCVDVNAEANQETADFVRDEGGVAYQ